MLVQILWFRGGMLLKIELDFEALGSRIRKLRKEKRLTQESLAERCEISTAFIGHIERGTRKLSIETLSRIAQELNASTDYLLFGSQAPDSGLLLHISSILEKKEQSKAHSLLTAVKILSEHLDEIE